MVGQEHVLQALINALDHNRMHHAYLFTGTRGVGKTTIARILAKCLNCEVGVSSEPCGQCSACQEINNGCFIDLIEVDAASNTGVDDVREIIDNAQYRPTRGRYKVYLIDEVHMLSKNAFNALLKTLEEPPEHVKFLLATTDPQKLPATILSRCLQFHLKNMAPERIVAHLQNILQKEMIDCEEQALWSLARAAEGSMRDALSLTDQAISFGSGKVLGQDVRSMLGTIDQQTVYHLAEALMMHDAQKILSVIAECSEQAPDYMGVMDELLVLLHRMTVAQIAPAAIDNSLGDQERVLALAQQVTAEELQLFYQMGLMGKRDLSLAPDLRTGLEMAVLRMLVFRPEGIAEPPIKALAATQASTTGATEIKKPEAVVSRKDAAAAVEKIVVENVVVEQEPVEQKQSVNNVVDIEVKPIADKASDHLPLSLFVGNQQWVEYFQQLPFSGLLKSVLAECVLLSVSDNGTAWQLMINIEQAQLYNERHSGQMAEQLSEYFAQPIHIAISKGSSDLITPALYLEQAKQAIYDKALVELQQDAGVQYLVNTYSAEIDTSTIAAIESEDL
jgi:DNA polymerase-3 subunit gamma/tau